MVRDIRQAVEAARATGEEEGGRMSEAETLNGGEPSDDEIALEALIAQPDPAWWDHDLERWDLLYPVIPF